MEVIDNRNKLLGDDIKKELKNGEKLKITVTCFSIYAFDALKEELHGIEEKILDKIKKENKEFYREKC